MKTIIIHTPQGVENKEISDAEYENTLPDRQKTARAEIKAASTVEARLQAIEKFLGLRE